MIVSSGVSTPRLAARPRVGAIPKSGQETRLPASTPRAHTGPHPASSAIAVVSLPARVIEQQQAARLHLRHGPPCALDPGPAVHDDEIEAGVRLVADRVPHSRPAKIPARPARLFFPVARVAWYLIVAVGGRACFKLPVPRLVMFNAEDRGPVVGQPQRRSAAAVLKTRACGGKYPAIHVTASYGHQGTRIAMGDRGPLRKPLRQAACLARVPREVMRWYPARLWCVAAFPWGHSAAGLAGLSGYSRGR